MRSFTAKPCSGVLATFVKLFHYHESDLPFTLERIMPNGQAHLMVNLAEDEFRTYGARPEQVFRNSGAVVAGAHAKSIVIDTREQRWLAAVEFLPGGASRFFSMPMTELSNQVVPLQDLWRNDGMFLRERLLDARTPAAKFSIFEEVLLHHMRLEFDPAIQCAITTLRAGASLERALSRLGLSARTLERRFSSQVGIPPSGLLASTGCNGSYVRCATARNPTGAGWQRNTGMPTRPTSFTIFVI